MPTKHLLQWFFICCMALVLAACSEENQNQQDPNTIRVGVMLGTEQELMSEIKKIAKNQYDLNIVIIPYTYLPQLNKALAEGEIDVNIFQYPSYLKYSEKKNNYRFAILGETYIYPMGVYSKKITNILAAPKGAMVAIPDEPTNEARALFLLEKAGLIRMKSPGDLTATTEDIASNPSGFKFFTFPASELANTLPNVDFAVLNASVALAAGLLPSKDALVIENENSAYANIAVVREGEENQPRMKAFMELLHSAEVQEVVGKLFQDQAIPAWKE